MGYIRHAAVAGVFYPGNARDLNDTILRLLAEAETRSEPGPVPKAIIAPHAGLMYSGSIAASAYVRLKPAFDRIKRVVLIGPSHRVPLRGLGISSAKAFETPVGTVPIDLETMARLTAVPHIEISDDGHAEEHSLEVQLPFLQAVLDDFSIVPLVCNQASADVVADVLEAVWGGSETLIVVSSDLSHFLPYASARKIDEATCSAIETLDLGALNEDQACGFASVGGLLVVAKRRRMRVTTLDLRNSGDTAGDRQRVVGYGAWMFLDRGSDAEPAEAGHACDGSALSLRTLVETHGRALLDVAVASIRQGLERGEPLRIDTDGFPAAIRNPGASFITLSLQKNLRGCIGSSAAHQPLVADVAANAFAAAFSDRRFSRLSWDELADLHIHISVLNKPQPVDFDDETSLLSQLRPGIDGVILEIDQDRALFLPQVWRTLSGADTFIAHLKQKAGYAADFWSPIVKAWTFQTHGVSSDTLLEKS